jgi:Predicted metal binding domain
MNEAASKELFDQDVGKITDKLLATRGWKLYSREFPVLDVGFQLAGRTEMRVRLVAQNWNDSPPFVELLDSEGRYLAPANIPRGPTSVFNQNIHPATGRPFVCMAGSREYHTYANHVSDSWDNYKRRDSYTLGGIVTQLWNAWLKATP